MGLGREAKTLPGRSAAYFRLSLNINLDASDGQLRSGEEDGQREGESRVRLASKVSPLLFCNYWLGHFSMNHYLGTVLDYKNILSQISGSLKTKVRMGFIKPQDKSVQRYSDLEGNFNI